MSSLNWITILAASIVLARSIGLSSAMSRAAWKGHIFRFAAVAAGHSMLAAGALGIILGWSHGTVLLLAGVAVKLMSERRREHA